ncbi:MAG TPA: ATP synthase F1 subunit delta [Planctomycetaceae bacterium]|nr:ATP synthase F1 subunit delta [Planctomycetaceae bacterium]
MPDLPPNLPTRVPHVLEDPGARAVARVYADAFLRAAEKFGVEAGLEEFGSFIDDVLAQVPHLESVLTSGIINRDEKLALIDRAIAPQASPLFANFLRVLARHDRLDLLPIIRRLSVLEHERRQGFRHVQVTTATPLSDDLREQIRREIDAALPFTPILDERVDPSLLGGMVIQIGDTLHDMSLSARLNQLRDRLRKRTLHEIQSGRDRFSSATGD